MESRPNQPFRRRRLSPSERVLIRWLVAGLLAGFLLDGVVAALVLGAYFRGVLSRGDAQLWVTFGIFVGPLVGGAIMLVGFRRFARAFGAGKKSTESGGKPDQDGRGAL